MLTKVILPQLGDTMNEGTILKWLKREGERVEKGEPLFEVLTDKANMEVEATASGFVRAIRHRENETVPTGEVIAVLATTPDEPLEPAPLASRPAGNADSAAPLHGGEGIGDAITEHASEPGEDKAEIEPPEWMTRKRQFVSPRARRLAEQQGVDLAQVTASSRTGRIVEADVMHFLARRTASPTITPTVVAPSPAPPKAEPVVTPVPTPSVAAGDHVVPLAGIRKVIAERMGASARETARVTLTTDADATRLVELRAEINERATDTRYSFTDFFVLLTARALQQFPYMNSTLQADGIHQHGAVHIGIAVDTERGLLVPVIRDVQIKGLGAIARDLRELGEQARTGKISPDALRGSTFTITNLGQYEIDAFTPIINAPETAILGIGRIAQKPAAYQGQLALRHMVALSLSFDHRVVDGAPAARFLQQVKRLVETPGLLLI